MRPKAVLKELFDLLESYAPTWYTQEQHQRVSTALRLSPKPGPQLVKPRQQNHASPESSELNPETPGSGVYLQ